MSKAIIIIEDINDGEISIEIKFGDGGINKDSNAHYLGLKAVEFIQKIGRGDDEDD